MAKAQRQCPDCGGTMHEIHLIDKAHFGSHTELEYALSQSKRSIWTGAYPVEGRVTASMCPACGRIALYGAARSKRKGRAG